MALTIILNTINPRYNKAALLELSFIQNFSQSQPKRMHLKLDYTKHIDKLLHLELSRGMCTLMVALRAYRAEQSVTCRVSERPSLSPATPTVATLFLHRTSESCPNVDAPFRILYYRCSKDIAHGPVSNILP